MQAHPSVTLHPSFQGPTVSKKSFPVHSTSDMLIQCVINQQKEQVKINAVAERKSTTRTKIAQHCHMCEGKPHKMRGAQVPNRIMISLGIYIYMDTINTFKYWSRFPSNCELL
jgi:hypothetical protein